MQSSFYTPTNTHHLPIPWKIPETQFTTQKCVPKTRKRPFRAFNITNSLRTSIGYEPEETVGKEPGHTKECRLPVVIQRSGKVSRYFWDGGSLQLVGVDGGATSFSFDFDDGFRRLYRICTMAVRDFFIPKKVSDNYMDYVKWKFLHRVFSSALQVLATQAMFRAIGVGFSRSLPSAAALNWVLKDGLGRLSRCIYTASQASAFDTNLKSAVHRSFAIADNLGEVSAKSQIQTVCFDNLGLLLAASLNMLLKNNQRLLAGLPFIVYPIFSAIDLLGIYQQLKHVHLQTLTKDRLEIILDTWIEVGYVPSPADISKQEGIGFPWSKGKELLPIKIGCINPKDQVPKLSMMAMQSINGDDYYFISMEITYTGIRRTKQACYVRKVLHLKKSKWESMVEASDLSDSAMKEWFKLLEECKKRAQGDLLLLNEHMSGLGWAAKNILLSKDEQTRYSFVED